MSSDIALTSRNPANGRFELAWNTTTKDVVFDDSQEHAVMSQLVEWRGRWWADENGTHGSTLNDIKTITKSTASDAESAARQALQLLVDQQLIEVKSVVAEVAASMGRFIVTAAWSKRGSNQIQTTRVLV